jgi:hypothetical protein
LDSMGIIDEEEEYDDLEDWELRCETVTALVSRWDPILGSAGDEEYEQGTFRPHLKRPDDMIRLSSVILLTARTRI